MGIISGFVQLLGQISAFFLSCTDSGVQTPLRPTLKAALEHTSLPGEEQVWRWCGGPGCGSSGSNRHTGEQKAMGTRELDPAGAFLSAQGGRRQGPACGAEPAMEAPSSFNNGALLLRQLGFPPQVFWVAHVLTPIPSGYLLSANISLLPGFALQTSCSSPSPYVC